MDIGMIGLGKMGRNKVARVLQGGHRVAVYDLNADAVRSAREKGAEGAWSLLTGLLRTWEDADRCGACRLRPYPAGTWGPPEADALLAADGRAWRVP